MAMSSLRLRRALSISSSFLKHQRLSYSVHATSNSPSLSSLTAEPQSPKLDLIQLRTKSFDCQSRNFRSTSVSLSSSRRPYANNNEEEIGPDTILFEGCDYNHWLITMDFPKDPAPTREEMIETYLQTLAKVVGSYEEAKKKMYACSTTTYQGFNCLVTEEESEKFRGLPGVVFILPDSYIDPVNKEYGGDKYENGVITPRPPPVQYGRSGGRFDRNRDNRNGPRAPAGDGYRRDSMPMSTTPGGRGPMPSYQNEQRYNNPPSGSFPRGQRDIRGDNNNYGPQQGAGGNISQPAGNYTRGPGGASGNISQPAGNYTQGPGGAGGNISQPAGNYTQGPGGNFPQGQSSTRGDGMNYGPPKGTGGNIDQSAGIYEQGPGVNFPQGQSNVRGDGMNYGRPPQGAGGNFGQPGGSYAQGPGGSFPQGQSNIRGDGMSYSPPRGAGGNIGQPAGSYVQGSGGNLPQGQSHIRGDTMNYGPPPGAGVNMGQSAVNYVQGVRGNFPQGQTDLRGESRFGHPGAGNYGHQVGRGDGQISGGNFPQEQRGFRGDHMSYGHPQGPGAPTQSRVRFDYGQNAPGDELDPRFQQAGRPEEQNAGRAKETYPRTDQGRY